MRSTYHKVIFKTLQSYLNEFQFRFNKHWNEADLSIQALRLAITAKSLPDRRLMMEASDKVKGNHVCYHL